MKGMPAQKILVNGELVPAATCRNCLMAGRTPKLHATSTMRMIRNGWYCGPCVKQRKDGLAKAKMQKRRTA